MKEPLIYKYQPKSLEESNLDPTLLAFLEAAIESDQLVLLLVGPSGSGKTTLVNTILHRYYKGAKTGDNVLSINSLQDQGISYCRTELKTFCQTACTVHGRKKSLVLDDIDLINEQSQQVFRHCMDNFSKNVNFVATCTNTQKVVDSLQSRFAIVNVPPCSRDYLGARMDAIAKAEGISLEPEAREFALTLCGSSMRTMLNYLEKFALLGATIDPKTASAVCTNISYDELFTFTERCKAGDLAGALQQIYKIHGRGYSVMDVLDGYFGYIKYADVMTEDQKYSVVPVICKYITIFNQLHEDEIELAFFTNHLVRILS
jgi:DNA polymerase III delta prime subunit